MSESSEERQARLQLRSAAQEALIRLETAGPTFDAIYPPTNDMASLTATEAAKAQGRAYVKSLREAMKILEQETGDPAPAVEDD